jgi:hypothetical protein
MSVEEAAAERGEEALALSAILEDAFRDLSGDFAGEGDESVVPCVVCGRVLHSFPIPLNLSLLCPFPLKLSLLCPPDNPN